MTLATVIIRAKDEAASIGHTLDLLASQDVADSLETIVVDSGSQDSTVSIARANRAKVIEIPAESFTFGHSLNRGCRAATGEIVIALSAHAFPTDTGWARRLLAAFEDEHVACACGYDVKPDGSPLTERRVQDAADVRQHPFWGYTNGSGAFRRELWQDRGFREDMPGTEDKEWAAYWISRGYLGVVDPDFAVDHTHDAEGPRLTYLRSRREWEGFAMYLDLPPYSLGQLARDWWDVQNGIRRVSWRRAVTMAGEWSGRRRGRSR
jgi:rhamnosyltransferase